MPKKRELGIKQYVGRGTGTIIPADTSIYDALTFQHQPDATLDQAAPVQNTWYTVLAATANVILYHISGAIRDTGETVELRITIDANVRTASAALVANTDQAIGLVYSQTAQGLSFGNITDFKARAFLLIGRNVKVEIRKITAAGVGNLQSNVIWGKR